MEDGPPIFPPDFSCPAVLWIQLADSSFRVRDSHSLWWTVPCPSANLCQYRIAVLTPQILLPTVWPLPRSLATTCGISVDFFSSPYLDVSVQAVPHVYLCIQYTLTEYCSAGFPHSDIHGSMPAFGSPWLIADCCVLRRLLVPRHSPCALCSLTTFLFRITCFFFEFPHSTIIYCSFLPNILTISHFTSFLCSVFKVRSRC